MYLIFHESHFKTFSEFKVIDVAVTFLSEIQIMGSAGIIEYQIY